MLWHCGVLIVPRRGGRVVFVVRGAGSVMCGSSRMMPYGVTSGGSSMLATVACARLGASVLHTGHPGVPSSLRSCVAHRLVIEGGFR